MGIRLALQELFFYIETRSLSRCLKSFPGTVRYDLVLCGLVAQPAGHVARMRATFSWREKTFENCVGAKTVKSRGLRGPFRHFGLARRVPSPRVTNIRTCDVRQGED